MVHALCWLVLDRASVIFYPSGSLRFQSFCFWLASAFGTSLWRGPHVIAAVQTGKWAAQSFSPSAHELGCSSRAPYHWKNTARCQNRPPRNLQRPDARIGELLSIARFRINRKWDDVINHRRRLPRLVQAQSCSIWRFSHPESMVIARISRREIQTGIRAIRFPFDPDELSFRGLQPSLHVGLLKATMVIDSGFCSDPKDPGFIQ